jgi:hypothetical protein
MPIPSPYLNDLSLTNKHNWTHLSLYHYYLQGRLLSQNTYQNSLSKAFITRIHPKTIIKQEIITHMFMISGDDPNDKQAIPECATPYKHNLSQRDPR